VQEECRTRLGRAGEGFSGAWLRSEAGACPGTGKEEWKELEEIKGRGPRECVFVLHRFCTDLEYYVSVAKANFHLSTHLSHLLLPYL
jgi:hypothetical protein